MTLDEIATWIANHPLQGRRSKWMSDDAGDMAVRMIELMPDPTAMTHEEVNTLLRIIESGGKLTTESEVTFKVDARSIQVHQKVYRTTPLHPGLFNETNMPIEEGLVERVMTDLSRALDDIGYEGEPVLSASPSKERISVHGFRSLQFTLKRPEADGVYVETMSFEHLPTDEFEKQIEILAKRIDKRWRLRDVMRRDIAEERARVEPMLKGVPSIAIVDIVVNSMNYHGNTGDKLFYTVHLDIVGDTLERVTRGTGTTNDDMLRKLIRQHLRNAEQLGNADPVDMRTCEPILAAAMRQQAAVYGRGLLTEIEKAVSGRSGNPKDPRKRGISNLSFTNGELRAPVTIAPGVRMTSRIKVESVERLPSTIMMTLPGRTVRSVIDHPYFEGLTIHSATINSKGLHIRPNKATVMLKDVVADIRATIAQKDGKTP